MALPDPDQDLLHKLDRRQRRSDILSFAPAFGIALAAGLVSFALLRFALHGSAESALDVGGLVFIITVCVGCLRAKPGKPL
jgi:hypothetical protein